MVLNKGDNMHVKEGFKVVGVCLKLTHMFLLVKKQTHPCEARKRDYICF